MVPENPFGISAARALRALNAWPEGSLKSTNLSGLAFLPAGNRIGTDGSFQASPPIATFWASHSDRFGHYLGIIQGSKNYITTGASTKAGDGFSVRCVNE